MKFISHRGFWQASSEKNSMSAFERAFVQGFGIETDIRDINGRLVISHDPATFDCTPLEDLLELRNRINPGLPLALNIKSDGLQVFLRELLAVFHVEHYFVFDMSIPDSLGYIKSGMKIFVRQSEYEPDPLLYDQATGIWMDCFLGDWFTENAIEHHIAAGKQVCLVSPELHHREYRQFWEKLAGMPCVASEKLMLCTDFPEKARERFYGKH